MVVLPEPSIDCDLNLFSLGSTLVLVFLHLDFWEKICGALIFVLSRPASGVTVCGPAPVKDNTLRWNSLGNPSACVAPFVAN